MRRAVTVALVAWPAIAAGQRPILAGEQTLGRSDVLVHYATTGGDAVPATDANTDGVPDFVAEVANEAQLAFDRFAAVGFARPLRDTLGGDDRIDVYLRDLVSADGNAGTDTCSGGTCVGYAVAENDYRGYAYPTVTEGIRSVVPHELFHLVQYAYAMEQPSTWSEGTAVWAVEQLYGDGNSDFERFVPAFLAKTFRPYERGGGGFGDAYPYGAALWPQFLTKRFGVGIVVDAWVACRDAGALEAIDIALRARGSSFDAEWVALTRDNAFAKPLPPREQANAQTIYIEGLSARYVPFDLATPMQLELVTTSKIAAALVTASETIEIDGPTIVEPGSYLLVVTGLARGTIATPVELRVTEPEPDDGGGGCAASRPSLAVALALLAFARRKR